MIQPNLAGSPEAKRRDSPKDGSPQANVQARQRRKIRSPKRLRFENEFERHMSERYVEVPIKKIPEKEQQMMERPPMDFHTKPEGSKNTLVQKNQEQLNWQKKKRQAELNNRNLNVIEQEAV